MTTNTMKKAAEAINFNGLPTITNVANFLTFNDAGKDFPVQIGGTV